MEFELRECPFCGQRQAAIFKSMGRRGAFLYAKCEFCGAQGKTFGTPLDFDDPDIFDSHECALAVRAWNMRGGASDA